MPIYLKWYFKIRWRIDECLDELQKGTLSASSMDIYFAVCTSFFIVVGTNPNWSSLF